MSEDPAATFFPDGNVDLYAVLTVPPSATPSEIKSAYRRLALKHHPDKVQPRSTDASTGTGTSTNDAARDAAVVADVNLKFQQIGFAYAVLSDDKRRARYDESGRTDELASGKTEAEWKDYFDELWSGEVTSDAIDKFAEKYRGSDEEKQDLFNAYKTFSGELESILNNIMCSTVEDEDRFVELINQAIKHGQLKSTAKWKKAIKDTKGKEKRKAAADKEAIEADEYAKELGVYDQLRNGKGKGKGKNKGAKDAGEDDEAGLLALIQGNQQKRMDALMSSLEAKYGAGAKEKKSSKKRSSIGGADENDDGSANAKSRTGKKRKPQGEEPSEEDFQRIQAEIDARRGKGKK